MSAPVLIFDFVNKAVLQTGASPEADRKLQQLIAAQRDAPTGSHGSQSR